MKFLVIIAIILACCYAAPTSDLQHPSPINPAVLAELKPQKKETKQNVYTTAKPDERPHHITKRDHKPEHENKQKAPEQPKKSSQPTPQIAKKPAEKSNHEPRKVSSSNKRNRRHTENYQQPQTLTAVLTETTEPTKQVFQIPQTLPAILTESDENPQQHKRDIPVPLVPKQQHPEESAKDSSEEKQKENNSKTIPKENHQDEVQVEDLSEPKPLHQTLNLDHAVHNNEQKPNILLDHVSAHVMSSSTEHPVIRPKPVPVAELFARSHDN